MKEVGSFSNFFVELPVSFVVVYGGTIGAVISYLWLLLCFIVIRIVVEGSYEE